MTHFATADDPDVAYLEYQLAASCRSRRRRSERFPAIVVHAANSAAVLAERATHFDMARCGVAIYGLDPFQQDPREHDLEPALALESYVAAVKPFATGESAGYGRTWSAARPTVVGTLPIGYGDGYRRGLSNAADVLVDGRRYPVVGTISMDNTTVDLGSGTAVRGRRAGDADRSAGGRARARRGPGPHPRDDQLRDHLRPHQPRAAPCTTA